MVYQKCYIECFAAEKLPYDVAHGVFIFTLYVIVQVVMMCSFFVLDSNDCSHDYSSTQ